MLRLVLIVAAMGAAFFILRAVGVFIVLAAIALLVVAYRWPQQAEKVSGSPVVQRLPVWTRATPMRFGFVMLAFLVPATAMANAVGAPRTDLVAQASASSGAVASATPATTPQPTVVPTAEPTQRATPQPTPEPTPEPTPVFGREPTGPTQRAVVTRVIDGDTIEVAIGGVLYRVRYIGIDSPEPRRGDWMATEATRANARLVDGRQVTLEKDVSETDRYGRLLRYVWVRDASDWLLVNAELLRRGVAQITTYPPDVKYVDTIYVAAERKATSRQVGLWGPTPAPAPTAPPPVAAPSNCHSSYQGACLMIGVEDYDCAGGSGNGPYYTGTVTVVGYDEYELDADGDGIGCELS